MDIIVALLGLLALFVLPIATLIGLAKPSLFKGVSRKKIAGIGFGGSFILLVLAGILLPPQSDTMNAQADKPALEAIQSPKDNQLEMNEEKEQAVTTEIADTEQSLLAQSKQFTKEDEELVYNFCYSLQAIGECDDLNMRLDTEAKIQDRLQVADIRSSDSTFGDTCMQGITAATKSDNLCKTAWDKFGCHGSTTPRLLQQNPFGNQNAILCRF